METSEKKVWHHETGAARRARDKLRKQDKTRESVFVSVCVCVRERERWGEN